MKSLIALTVILSLAFTTAQTVQAGSKERAIFGGIVGGMIIGSIIDNNHDRHNHHKSVTTRHHHKNHYDGCGCGGHYDIITVREWIPGTWTYSRDSCGHRARNYIKGHYVNREQRVWASHTRQGHRDSTPRRSNYNRRDDNHRHDNKERYATNNRSNNNNNNNNGSHKRRR